MGLVEDSSDAETDSTGLVDGVSTEEMGFEVGVGVPQEASIASEAIIQMVFFSIFVSSLVGVALEDHDGSACVAIEISKIHGAVFVVIGVFARREEQGGFRNVAESDISPVRAGEEDEVFVKLESARAVIFGIGFVLTSPVIVEDGIASAGGSA